MRCFSFVCLVALVAVLPDIQAAPVPKPTDAKPAVINAGTENNVAWVLQRVVDHALIGVHENKKVADLPIVRRQKDLDAWLKKNLRVERIPRTNHVRVRFREGKPEEQSAIINAAVDYYLKKIIGERRDTLTADLQKEKARHADPRIRRKLKVSPEQVATAEKRLKEREEYIRNLPALVEHAKAR
jgi:uncharacterized protein involved in exopolysaccharide biosynthesis